MRSPVRSESGVSVIHAPAACERVGDREDVGETRDLEDLHDARVGHDDVEVATELPAPLERADEHTQGGRVQERDLQEVEHDRRLALRRSHGGGLPQLRRCRHVDLPADRDHRSGGARPLLNLKLLIHSVLLAAA